MWPNAARDQVEIKGMRPHVFIRLTQQIFEYIYSSAVKKKGPLPSVIVACSMEEIIDSKTKLTLENLRDSYLGTHKAQCQK